MLAQRQLIDQCNKPSLKVGQSLKVKVLMVQSCQTLCNPMNCSPSGSSIHGILQARVLERVASPFSRGSSRPRDQTQVCFKALALFQLSTLSPNPDGSAGKEFTCNAADAGDTGDSGLIPGLGRSPGGGNGNPL